MELGIALFVVVLVVLHRYMLKCLTLPIAPYRLLSITLKLMLLTLESNVYGRQIDQITPTG